MLNVTFPTIDPEVGKSLLKINLVDVGPRDRLADVTWWLLNWMRSGKFYPRAG